MPSHRTILARCCLSWVLTSWHRPSQSRVRICMRWKVPPGRIATERIPMSSPRLVSNGRGEIRGTVVSRGDGPPVAEASKGMRVGVKNLYGRQGNVDREKPKTSNLLAIFNCRNEVITMPILNEETIQDPETGMLRRITSDLTSCSFRSHSLLWKRC